MCWRWQEPREFATLLRPVLSKHWWTRNHYRSETVGCDEAVVGKVGVAVDFVVSAADLVVAFAAAVGAVRTSSWAIGWQQSRFLEVLRRRH